MAPRMGSKLSMFRPRQLRRMANRFMFANRFSTRTLTRLMSALCCRTASVTQSGSGFFVLRSTSKWDDGAGQPESLFHADVALVGVDLDS